MGSIKWVQVVVALLIISHVAHGHVSCAALCENVALKGNIGGHEYRLYTQKLVTIDATLGLYEAASLPRNNVV